jgi:hypothetical protein
MLKNVATKILEFDVELFADDRNEPGISTGYKVLESRVNIHQLKLVVLKSEEKN